MGRVIVYKLYLESERMSFSYMFKFIIIGDTGMESMWFEVSESLASSCSSSTIASGRSTRSPSESSSGPRWSPSAIRPSNCKSGIQYAWTYPGRAGVIQVDHERVLPLSRWGYPGLRYHEPGVIRKHLALARGGQDQWQLWDGLRSGRQQMRYVIRVLLISLRRKVTYEEGAKFAK